MNDPVHANDVTHNHFGFLIEIDAILREKGCDEIVAPTAPLYELSAASNLPQPQWPSNDSKSDILTHGTGKGIAGENYLFLCDLYFVAR